MKPECQKCALKDKSEKACIKRQCEHAPDITNQLPPQLPTPSKWPLKKGDTVGNEEARVTVTWIDGALGHFEGRIASLKDLSQQHGHYGSYVTEGHYYKFEMIRDHTDRKENKEIVWEIPSYGTDRFHREGSTGAQFLLYWSDDQGFSFDLDS